MAVLDLADDASTVVADYSAGMVKKIGLAAALIHAPRLLVLDEPFEAVDPVSGQVIRTILRRYVVGGGTVVMSSHVMELVEGLCDRVAVISGGRVLAADTVSGLTRGGTLHDRFLELVGATDSAGGPHPAAVPAAALAAVLGVLTAVLLSRVVTSEAAGPQASRVDAKLAEDAAEESRDDPR